MIRLILLVILVLFVVWVLQANLRRKDNNKNKDTLDSSVNSDQTNLGPQNLIFIIITAVILLALVVWLLPKFGINIFAILQKIIPLITSMRSILSF